MAIHKHLIIRAEVNNPPMTEKYVRLWLRKLVKKIDMNIIKGPYASYVQKEGNRGVTGVVMIETSHIAIHVWDESSPALVQCDVYSCAEFSSNEVLAEFMPMDVVKIDHLLLDRDNTLWSNSNNSSITWWNWKPDDRVGKIKAI
jgi:S-adenosylmethionine/arginine decarboxylase-like enzyme